MHFHRKGRLKGAVVLEKISGRVNMRPLFQQAPTKDDEAVLLGPNEY